MKINIYCEGSTEKGLKGLLYPVQEKLREKRLGLSISEKGGAGNLLKHIGKLTENSLKGKAIAVFCLLDLHNIHENFPAQLTRVWGGRNWVNTSVEERVSWLKQNIKTQLIPSEYRNAFHVHIVVHEIETLIFADPDSLTERLGGYKIGNMPPPEEINDFNTPYQRLKEIFSKHHPLKQKYEKGVYGARILGKLSLQAVCEKCPHFADFVNDLRNIEP